MKSTSTNPSSSNQKLTPQSIINSIMKFTSLDQETVSSQLVPYLNSLKTKLEIEGYLQSLLGPGSEQAEFIKQLILDKFKSEQIALKQKQNQLDFPTLNAKPKLNSGISSSSNSVKITTKSKKPSASLNQPIQNHSDQTTNEDWSSKFGSHGNVYVKDKGNDQSLSKVGVKKPTNEKKVIQPDQSTSNLQNPLPIPELTKLEEKIQISKDTSDLKLKPLTTLSDLTIPLSEPILQELFQLERIITSLQSGPDSKSDSKTRACFCSGRVHDLPSSPLPNMCSNCGMIYCKLELPISPCPSCLKLDQVLTKPTNFKESIRSHFELKRQELIELEVERFERLQERSRVLALNEEKVRREFPTLSSSQDHQSSYVNQLTGGGSIEDRIREGYQKLQNLGESSQVSNSRTVLRLDAKSGKTKVVTTTKTIKNEKKSKTQVQEENSTKIKEIETEFLSVKSLDDLDDGYRLSLGLEPLFGIPYGNLRARAVKVVEYVPVMSYQNDV